MKTNTEIRKVICGQRIIEYHLTRKQVKNINLRIKPDGNISVSAHKNVPAAFIDNFLKSKQQYIIRALDKYEQNSKYTAASPKQYIDGESFNILGKSLHLKIAEGIPESVSTDGTSIFLTVRNKDNFNRKEKLITTWLKNLQQEIFSEISTETYSIFKKYNIPYPQIKIRSMTARWGSCQPRKGIITLNSKLIAAPRNCIEYVVLHEFAHFIHPNHSRNFYNFIAILMPDWKERKAELAWML